MDTILKNNCTSNNLYELLPYLSSVQISRRMNKLGLKRKNKKSKYKYVFKSGNKWRVAFYLDGKYVSFGYYDSEDEAGRVAMEKAKEYGKI